MQTGNRWSGHNPMDLTLKTQKALLADKAAKDAAASIDVSEVRRQARTDGFAAGYDQGYEDGWDALAAHLVNMGVLAADDEEGE
jgi:hypothetical protein